MQTEDLRLDGNAAGGLLRDVFTHEMTAAMATCAGCRAMGPVGALLEYGHGMGVILCCPGCHTPVLRIARTPALMHLDFTGLLLLTIPESV